MTDQPLGSLRPSFRRLPGRAPVRPTAPPAPNDRSMAVNCPGSDPAAPRSGRSMILVAEKA
jgi:hypothetical protein